MGKVKIYSAIVAFIALFFDISVASADNSCSSMVSGPECEDEISSHGNALLQRTFAHTNVGSSSSGPQIIERPTDKNSLIVPLDQYFAQAELPHDKPVLQFDPPENFQMSYLHEIVGPDGVKVITLDRTPERFEHTAIALSKGGIIATSFPATDATLVADEQLLKGCSEMKTPKVLCAISDSHRRALKAASLRKKDWTVILEDDVALLDPKQFDRQFTSAWKVLEETSPDTRIVRLQWCMIMVPEDDHGTVFRSAEGIELKKWTSKDNISYNSGCCTGGYMVHKDIIPEMLSLFPCRGALDICFKFLLYDRPENGNDGDRESHGMKIMVNMEPTNSRERINNATGMRLKWMGQHGMMYQDRPALPSLRDQLLHQEQTNSKPK